MAELLVRGGTAVLPGQGQVRCEILVEGGRIAALLAPGDEQPADRVVDATGRYVLPGIIDPHLHVGLGNGLEDWNSETKSAAAGGVTTIISFLMSSQPYLPLFKETNEAATRLAHVDYSFHVVPCTPTHLEEMPALIEAGITSFKYFTSFRGDEGLYLGISGTDDGFLYTYLQQVAAYEGAIAAIHPENIEVVWKLRKQLQDAGRDDLPAWDESRPIFVETECSLRAMFFAQQTGAPLYLVHVSGALPTREIRSWRSRFPEARVFMETCPHYLTNTKDDPIGTLGKINPPLRSRADLEALWEAIADGTVDTIGSDHVARPLEKKRGSIWTATAAFPGTGTILPVLLSEGVNRRGIALERVVEICSTNPARIFGLYPRKGSLQIGSDADLTIVDLGLERTVTPELLYSFAGFSLYDGQTLKGWPVQTIVRGQVVMNDGQIVGQPGHGRYLPRLATRRATPA
ncbi:MAG: amidohydrolase family protein [Chloroflexi bacterium]|nr:amidohydrolase family protein [Chloroflexota bacterium]